MTLNNSSSINKTIKIGRRVFGRRRYLMGFLMSNARNLEVRATSYSPLTKEEESKILEAVRLLREVTDNRQKNWEIHKKSIIEKCKS